MFQDGSVETVRDSIAEYRFSKVEPANADKTHLSRRLNKTNPKAITAHEGPTFLGENSQAPTDADQTPGIVVGHSSNKNPQPL